MTLAFRHQQAHCGIRRSRGSHHGPDWTANLHRRKTVVTTTVPGYAPHDAYRAEIVDPDRARNGPADYELIAAAFLTSYRKATTRNNYREALKIWFAWCLDHGQDDPLRDVRRPHVEFWMRHQEEVQGLSVRTICGRCTALAGYYRTACRDGWLTESPMTWVKRPMIPRMTPSKDLTASELLRILNLAAERKDARDEAILCVLGYNGLRVGELCALNVEDLAESKGMYSLHIADRKNGDPGDV